MSGTIYRRGHSWCVGFTVNGRRVRETVGPRRLPNSLAQASTRLRSVRIDFSSGPSRSRYICSKTYLRTRRALSSRRQIYSQDRLVQQTERQAQWQSRSHFLPDRRFSTSAIHSNNCFITGPSGNSLAASIALACSGDRWVNRGGIYRFVLPDSFRDVLSLSIYHCGQKKLLPSRHDRVFHLCR